MQQYSEEELLAIVPEPNRPDDFADFWRSTLAEVARTPVEWSRTVDPSIIAADRPVEVIEFTSVDGQVLYGWYAAPPDGLGGTAGFLTLPGYSLGNPRPTPDLLFPDTSTFCINFHGNRPSTPYVHPSKTGVGYVTDGIDNPKTYIFRRFVMHTLIALRVLAAQPEVDPERIAIGGASQGGGLALVTSALAANYPPEMGDEFPQVRACMADIPWLCDLDRALSLVDLDRYRALLRENPAARLPDARMHVAFYAEDHPEKAEAIYRSYRYIDPLNHAADIECPVLVTAGGRDPSCRPPTVYSVYNAIKSHKLVEPAASSCRNKEILFVPTAGHEIVAEMTKAHARWLSSRLQ